MEFDKSNMIIDHDLNRLATEEVDEYGGTYTLLSGQNGLPLRRKTVHADSTVRHDSPHAASRREHTFLDYFDFRASELNDDKEPLSEQNATIISRFIHLLNDGNYVEHREVTSYRRTLALRHLLSDSKQW